MSNAPLSPERREEIAGRMREIAAEMHTTADEAMLPYEGGYLATRESKYFRRIADDLTAFASWSADLLAENERLRGENERLRLLAQLAEDFDAAEVALVPVARALVKAMLEALRVQDPTKNRYKAALSAFAKYLVEHEVIPANPVREVSAYQENPPRDRWLTPEQVRTLVEAQQGYYRIAGALMAGAGLEWQAVARMTTHDVDLATRFVVARGTKTRHRTRKVKVTEAWAWAIIADHVRSLPAGARLVMVSEPQALRNHKRVSERLGLPITTLHDHRHSYAVQKIRQNFPPHLVRFQLGHAPGSRILEAVYAVHEPNAADYERAEQGLNAPDSLPTSPVRS